MKISGFFMYIVICSFVALIIGVCFYIDTKDEHHNKQEYNQNQRQKKNQEHKMKSSLTVGKLYFQHDPECPLCREHRKQEIISIVDSIISERITNSNNN